MIVIDLASDGLDILNVDLVQKKNCYIYPLDSAFFIKLWLNFSFLILKFDDWVALEIITIFKQFEI